MREREKKKPLIICSPFFYFIPIYFETKNPKNLIINLSTVKGWTEVKPEKEFIGCRKHYYSQPVKELRAPRLGEIPKLPQPAQAEILYYNSIKTLLVPFGKIRRYIEENQMNIKEEFEKVKSNKFEDKKK